MHTNRCSSNDKSCCFLFLISFFVNNSEFAVQKYDVILDTLRTNDCPWECSLTLCLPTFSSYHIPYLMTQKCSISKLKHRFDKWRWRNKALWRSTDSRWLRILTIVPNVLSRFLRVRISKEHIDFHPKFLFNWHCKNSIYCNELKIVSRFSIFVNAITSIIEILQFAVKMACKMTFNDYCRFSPNLWWYFLRKTQQSLFSTCFSVSCYAWMNTKIRTT